MPSSLQSRILPSPTLSSPLADTQRWYRHSSTPDTVINSALSTWSPVDCSSSTQCTLKSQSLVNIYSQLKLSFDFLCFWSSKFQIDFYVWEGLSFPIVIQYLCFISSISTLSKYLRYIYNYFTIAISLVLSSKSEMWLEFLLSWLCFLFYGCFCRCFVIVV